ncbi:glutathione peroxidase [Bdellovibrio bacteriovorus]|uniref:Glutathione peroxidase n=1 Tax=Bdellovibrio bacteriovorus TaxID=959 RepID=A0A161PFV6_BDEBC|nr:glutathione peroxidase [Bdellovibrio bacteriovorus]KYG69374.1 glutathione peroxidase [Bdellovibrio bacteriovorus]
MEKTLHSFTVKAADGSDVSLDKYKGQVVLVVNVASKCGFTPQYEGLEALYEKFKDQGFIVLGFPCNQFGSQEPGSNADIQQFCSLTYNVKFPVMAKVDVNGDSADPVYKWIKEAAPGLLGTEMIKWNFTKFLVGKDGKVIKRYPPQEEPKNLTADVQSAIK